MIEKKYIELIENSPNYQDILNKTRKSQKVMMAALYCFGLMFSLYYFFFIVKSETIYFPLQISIALSTTMLVAIYSFYSKTTSYIPSYFLVLDFFLLVLSLRHPQEIYIEIILISIFPVISFLYLKKRKAVIFNLAFFIISLLLFSTFDSFLGLRQSETSYYIILLATFIVISIIAYYSSIEKHEHLWGIIRAAFYDNQTELPAWQLLKLRMISTNDESLTIFRISNFQEIQKSLGVEISNKILCCVRDKLINCMDCDFSELFKLRGNDFVFLWESSCSLDDVENYLKKMMELFRIFSVRVDDNVVYLKAVAGTVPVVGDPVDVLHNAEYAVQLAELKLKPHILISDCEMAGSSDEYNKPFQILLDCFENNRIQLYYQSIIDLKSREMIKAEALVRFFDINGRALDIGPILKSTYSTGMNQKLTKFVLEEASIWALENKMDISVNIGFEDLINQDVIISILSVLQKFKIANRMLTLEVLESSSILDSALSYNNLLVLRNSGALIAIDDFGKGFANFDRILSLQPDIIKFDGALVKELPHNEDARYLVLMITKLAVKNGMKTVAEHVEDAEILDSLRDFTIDQVQGYYFGKPSPVLNVLKKI